MSAHYVIELHDMSANEAKCIKSWFVHSTTYAWLAFVKKKKRKVQMWFDWFDIFKFPLHKDHC